MLSRGFPHSSVGKESTCNSGDTGLIPGSGRSVGERIGYPLQYSRAFLVAQLVKNPPAMWEIWVQSLVGKIPWRRERLPTPVFCLENSMDCKESDITERLSFSLSKLISHWMWVAGKASPFGWGQSLAK